MQYKKLHNPSDPFFLFQKGKEEGFEHYFRAHYGPLTYFAYRHLQDRENAEDVVEDSFVKLWDRRELMKSGLTIKAYLYSTVRNACIDILRREKRKVIYLEESARASEKEDLPVLHRIIEAETMHQIHLAIEALPAKCGRVFRMFYLEGKSLQEIADELQVSFNTVKSQKQRALEIIRIKLPNILPALVPMILHQAIR
ncbi:MAG: RNA polymerase sigma-70 factor [Flavisolibacter sp.]